MKKIIESTEDFGITSSDSLSEYLMAIKQAINDETTAIALYDKIIGMSKTPTAVKEVLKEVRDDEKDHLVILTNLLQDEVESEMPGFGDVDTDGSELGVSIEEEE